jgi:hypothetical protein
VRRLLVALSAVALAAMLHQATPRVASVAVIVIGTLMVTLGTVWYLLGKGREIDRRID